MKTRSIIVLFSLALSFLLSGCLVSTTPLITAANSDRPLPAHFFISRDSDPGANGSVDLNEDNTYAFTDPSDSAYRMNLSFKKIADGTYAASQPMVVKEPGAAFRGYQYGYMQLSSGGDRIVIEWPDCNEFDAADME